MIYINKKNNQYVGQFQYALKVSKLHSLIAVNRGCDAGNREDQMKNKTKRESEKKR